jgi:hypothetical protein
MAIVIIGIMVIILEYLELILLLYVDILNNIFFN